MVATTFAPAGCFRGREIRSPTDNPRSRRGRFGPGESRRRESRPASRHTTKSWCIDEQHITAPWRLPARGRRPTRRQGAAQGAAQGPGQGVRWPRRKGPEPTPPFARAPQPGRTGAPAAAARPAGYGRRSSGGSEGRLPGAHRAARQRHRVHPPPARRVHPERRRHLREPEDRFALRSADGRRDLRPGRPPPSPRQESSPPVSPHRQRPSSGPTRTAPAVRPPERDASRSALAAGVRARAPRTA